jgi:molybdenum cofactor cytidylyltransferase
MNKENISAIILAAGMSTRMGAFKPLLPIGHTTAIENIIRVFRLAGVGDISVITGFRARDVASALKHHNVRLVLNESYADGMLSSIKTGIRHLRPDCEAFFILPTDIPLVRLSTVNALSTAFCSENILYPTFQDRRGHPPLISTHFSRDILNFRGEGGLQTFLAHHESFALDVTVADPGILLDMDTKPDYRKILARYRQYRIPTPEECLALLSETFGVDENVIDHGKMVAEVALVLGKAIQESKTDLNLDLLVAAGLLHDLARNQRDHARVAMQMLNNLDYPAVAEIVGVHMDIRLEDGKAITEKEIVFLADKLVNGTRIVGLKSRFDRVIKRYGSEPDVLASIKDRLGSALKIQHRVEQLAGRPLEAIVGPKLFPEQSCLGFRP